MPVTIGLFDLNFYGMYLLLEKLTLNINQINSLENMIFGPLTEERYYNLILILVQIKPEQYPILDCGLRIVCRGFCLLIVISVMTGLIFYCCILKYKLSILIFMSGVAQYLQRGSDR